MTNVIPIRTTAFAITLCGSDTHISAFMEVLKKKFPHGIKNVTRERGCSCFNIVGDGEAIQEQVDKFFSEKLPTKIDSDPWNLQGGVCACA